MELATLAASAVGTLAAELIRLAGKGFEDTTSARLYELISTQLQQTETGKRTFELFEGNPSSVPHQAELIGSVTNKASEDQEFATALQATVDAIKSMPKKDDASRNSINFAGTMRRSSVTQAESLDQSKRYNFGGLVTVLIAGTAIAALAIYGGWKAVEFAIEGGEPTPLPPQGAPPTGGDVHKKDSNPVSTRRHINLSLPPNRFNSHGSRAIGDVALVAKNESNNVPECALAALPGTKIAPMAMTYTDQFVESPSEPEGNLYIGANLPPGAMLYVEQPNYLGSCSSGSYNKQLHNTFLETGQIEQINIWVAHLPKDIERIEITLTIGDGFQDDEDGDGVPDEPENHTETLSIDLPQQH